MPSTRHVRGARCTIRLVLSGIASKNPTPSPCSSRPRRNSRRYRQAAQRGASGRTTGGESTVSMPLGERPPELCTGHHGASKAHRVGSAELDFALVRQATRSTRISIDRTSPTDLWIRAGHERCRCSYAPPKRSLNWGSTRVLQLVATHTNGQIFYAHLRYPR